MDRRIWLGEDQARLRRTLGEAMEVETIQSARIWPIDVDVNRMEKALAESGH
ncbi:hypothetical protein [Sphingobium sp. EM0848]|uniref:hypothetical protein n=1 Tax=Sphingobium sp. EM0848 TaxID=2743473 RepID=UPI00159C2124|nr:hypothetical protein [Sphingobium sp. EM0848]